MPKNRIAQIRALAEKVFNNKQQADEFLRSKHPALGGRIPLELLKTKAGAQKVEDLLMRIEYVVY